MLNRRLSVQSFAYRSPSHQPMERWEEHAQQSASDSGLCKQTRSRSDVLCSKISYLINNRVVA
jgi:hypothetical protein